MSKSEQILPRLIPFVYDVNTYQALSGVLTHIQLLWELILLNEPIAVVGNFPSKCAQTVQALGKALFSCQYFIRMIDFRSFQFISSGHYDMHSTIDHFLRFIIVNFMKLHSIHRPNLRQ